MECADRTPVATFFSTDSFSVGATLTLDDQAAHHIKVARVGVGECIALRDGAGKGAIGVLIKATKSSALVDVSEISEIPKPTPIHLLTPSSSQFDLSGSRQLIAPQRAKWGVSGGQKGD